MAATIEQGEAFAGLIWSDFVEEGGAIFLRSGRLAIAASLQSLGDLVAAESFVNHMHVLDQFDHNAGLNEEPFWNATHPDFKSAIRLANVIAEAWAARLAAKFPDRDFAVYATRDDDPVVRFHAIRFDLPLWLSPDGIDEMGAGAALLIIVRKGRISQRLGSIAPQTG
jgi:hypothetical protein